MAVGEADRSGNGSFLLRGMRGSTGRESTTFGFSILVTVTFALVQAMEGAPDVVQIFLYAAGAVLSFTLLTAVLSRGFRRPMPQHRTTTQALATSLNLLSVLTGLGVGLLLTGLLDGAAAWIVVPFAATLTYLLVEGIEEAVAERVGRAAGDRSAEDVTP